MHNLRKGDLRFILFNVGVDLVKLCPHPVRDSGCFGGLEGIYGCRGTDSTEQDEGGVFR